KDTQVQSDEIGEDSSLSPRRISGFESAPALLQRAALITVTALITAKDVVPSYYLASKCVKKIIKSSCGFPNFRMAYKWRDRQFRLEETSLCYSKGARR